MPIPDPLFRPRSVAKRAISVPESRCFLRLLRLVNVDASSFAKLIRVEVFLHDSFILSDYLIYYSILIWMSSQGLLNREADR